MAEDWLLGAFAEVEAALDAARTELASAREVLGPFRAQRAAGVPLPLIAAGLASRGGEARRSVAVAFQAYQRSVAALRARVVRALVDDEGMSLSELARQLGISRQAVTRLYDAGADPDRPDRK